MAAHWIPVLFKNNERFKHLEPFLQPELFFLLKSSPWHISKMCAEVICFSFSLKIKKTNPQTTYFMYVYTCRGQRVACWNRFSRFTVWVPCTKPRQSSCQQASSLTTWVHVFRMEVTYEGHFFIYVCVCLPLWVYERHVHARTHEGHWIAWNHSYKQ